VWFNSSRMSRAKIKRMTFTCRSDRITI
jgi:hypothetical protein